jgi:hypothetical protein
VVKTQSTWSSHRQPLSRLATLLTSCALGLAAVSSVAIAADFPPGTYEAGNLSVTFDKNGQYKLSQGGVVKVAGTYAVTGDEIAVTDTTGPWKCPKGQLTGSYHWETTLTGLAFTKMADDCEGRSAPMTTGPWKHKPQDRK